MWHSKRDKAKPYSHQRSGESGPSMGRIILSYCLLLTMSIEQQKVSNFQSLEILVTLKMKVCWDGFTNTNRLGPEGLGHEEGRNRQRLGVVTDSVYVGQWSV